MKRILFVVLPEKGHVHPLLGSAEELLRRGHDVRFYAPCDIRPSLDALGLEQAFADDRRPDLPDGARGAAFAALVDDPARLRDWIKAMLVDSVPDEVVRLEAVVRRLGVDVIVADPMAYAAPIVASRAGIPWAGISTSLNALVPVDWKSELIDTTRRLPRDELFASYGLSGRFRISDCMSPFLNVAFTTVDLVGVGAPDVLLVGSGIPRGGRGDVADEIRYDGRRPLVYMSLGSQNYHRPRMFEVVGRAVSELPLDVVFAIGDQPTLAGLPSNVRAVRYAPQLEILTNARAMISHGGANSVMEALTFGVPLLVSPGCNDQPHNARFVEMAGAGIVCDLSTADVETVRAAITRLVEGGSYRNAAQRIARSYRQAGGPSRVVDAVLALAS